MQDVTCIPLLFHIGRFRVPELSRFFTESPEHRRKEVMVLMECCSQLSFTLCCAFSFVRGYWAKTYTCAVMPHIVCLYLHYAHNVEPISLYLCHQWSDYTLDAEQPITTNKTNTQFMQIYFSNTGIAIINLGIMLNKKHF